MTQLIIAIIYGIIYSVNNKNKSSLRVHSIIRSAISFWLSIKHTCMYIDNDYQLSIECKYSCVCV